MIFWQLISPNISIFWAKKGEFVFLYWGLKTDLKYPKHCLAVLHNFVSCLLLLQAHTLKAIYLILMLISAG